MMDTFYWDLILMAGRGILEPGTNLDRISDLDGGSPRSCSGRGSD
jgi:hypothetical protein